MMRTIAIVEDQLLARTLMIPWLNNIPGWRVTIEARNGQDFITKLQGGITPDIVILDINMPIMDGFQTAEWLGRNNPTIPVLILTSLNSDIALIRLLKLGVRGFVKKDVLSANELETAIETTIKTGYYSHENRLAGIPNLSITDAEMKFLKLACTAMTYRAIAIEMEVSPRTVDGYRENLFQKLNVTSRVELALLAVRHGIIRV